VKNCRPFFHGYERVLKTKLHMTSDKQSSY
jgi:hypothetical protein